MIPNTMRTIELLTTDEDGHVIEGPKFPDDIGSGATYADGPPSGDYRLAYRHKFFRRDEHGQPMPETLVAFLVPEYLLADGSPTPHTLRLVAERMGWA